MPPGRPTRTEVHDPEGNPGGYRWLALLVMLALAGVAIVAGMGLAPGVLTSEQFVVALGGTTLVLALAVVGSLFLLDRTFKALRHHSDAIDAQQDAIFEAREEAWERHQEMQDRHFDERISALEDRLAEIEAEQGSLTRQAQGEVPTPFGAIHPVGAVDGLDEDAAERLVQGGIDDTEQMWLGNAKVLADRVERDVRTVRRWQDQAELMALADVDAPSATLLRRSGVHSIRELAAWEPEQLATEIEYAGHELGAWTDEPDVDHERVQRWIQHARSHDPAVSRVHRRTQGHRSIH